MTRTAQRDHLVVVCAGCGEGGAVANVALHQAHELARFCQVTLLSDSFPPGAAPAGMRYLKLDAARFDWLRRFGHVPRELAFASQAKAAIERLHAQDSVQAVLCHSHPVATLAASSLKRNSGIPFALMVHGDIFIQPKGRYDQRLTWLYRHTTPKAYGQADLILVPSPHMGKLAEQSNANPGSIRVIPNGIVASEIGLEPCVAPQPCAYASRLQLLYVGRLSVEKGVDLLLQAVARLRHRYPDIHLNIIGTGPRYPSLKDLCMQLGLDAVVDFIGQVQRQQLGQWYRQADVLCVPSRSDTFPTVVLEAMAAGTAVVGTRSGGMPYMIDHERTGLLCPAEDAASLASAIERFAGDRSLSRRLGQAGLQRVEREFVWPSIGLQLYQAIRPLMHKN